MKFLKILLLAVIMSPFVDEILYVSLYNEQCTSLASYRSVDSVYIKQTGEVVLYFVDGSTLKLNLKKKDAHEMQISAGKYFRSYIYETDKVVERLEPVCKGAI